MAATACIDCGAEVPEGARFCPSCGVSQVRTCPVCGAEQQATATFCQNCGAMLQEGAIRSQPAGAAEERRVVTVLFADLAGSTALGERLDPEDVRELQSELFALVVREVERHDGVCEKFVGDAIMAVFGIPIAHEDDPERAVLAALAVQREMPELAERVRDRHGTDVALRIGVNTGEVVSARDAAARGQLMVSGDAVNVAARLQQHADSGQVVVGDRTQMATRRVIQFRALEPLVVKGKQEPLTAHLAVAPVTAPRRRGLDGERASLVGRERELELLEAVVARAVADRTPQLVTIFGQAGVGKTRLLEELSERVGEALLLVGRCIPYGEGVAYWPLAEVAKRHAGILDTDAAEPATEKLMTAVSVAVGNGGASVVRDALTWTVGLAQPSVGTSAEAVRRVLHDGWARFLAGLADEDATLLVLEDIQWASAEMLDLAQHLASVLDDVPVLVVCSARPEFLDDHPSWGAGMQNATAINLPPLTREDTGRLMADLLHGRLTAESGEVVLAQAEGNPFYLEEILAMLIDRGALTKTEDGWAGQGISEVPIPDSVHGVIAARIDLLPADQRDALRRCSVIGRTFWPDAAGVDADLVAVITRTGLVGERQDSVMEGMREFAFRHALTRDVAYASLPRSERRELHQRAAEWIDGLSRGRGRETVELVADHYLRALESGEPTPKLREQAYRALIAAGSDAITRGAPESAQAMLLRARELAPTPHERRFTDILIARADLQFSNYSRATRRLTDVGREAEAAGDMSLIPEAASWLSRVLWLQGSWAEAVEATDAAVTAAQALGDESALAHAVARRAQLGMLRSLPGAGSDAATALELARRVGDRALEANALITAYSVRGNLGGRVTPDEMVEALAIAREVGSADEITRAIANFVWVADRHLPIPQVDRAYRDAVAATPEVTLAPQSWRYVQLSHGLFCLLPAGGWDELDAVLLLPGQSGAARLLQHQLLADLALRRGELDEGIQLVNAVVEAGAESEEPQRIVPAQELRAALAALIGDRESVIEAAAAVTTLLRDSDRQFLLTGSALVRALMLVDAGPQFDRLVEAAALPPSAQGYKVEIARSRIDGYRLLTKGEPLTAVGPLSRARDLEQARGAIVYAADRELDIALAYDRAGRSAEADAARARAAAVHGPLAAVHPL
jgi:class 3 adenylate cyclase